MPAIFDFFYVAATLLASPYILAKMLTGRRFRSGLSQRLGWLPAREGDKPCFWVHAASVGEVNTASALIKALEEEYPDWDIVISTSTDTGFANARKKFEGRQIVYFPLDFSWVVRKAFARLRPDCIVLVELEIWPNFLVEAHKTDVPVVLVSGRISEKSRRFLNVMQVLSGAFSRSLCCTGNAYCARTWTDASRFLELGIPEDRVLVTGNMKYDNLPVDVPEAAKEALRRSFGLRPEDTVLVGGSTHPGEEELLLRVFKTLRCTMPALRLILAPRHIERANVVEGYIKNLGLSPVRKSTLDGKESLDFEPGETVVLIDTIGDLTSIYSLADCVFVGKSLKGVGGQNIMEPAALARPTVFGPNMINFEEEMGLLLEADAAKIVHSEEELLGTAKQILNDPKGSEQMGIRARETVLSQKGATYRSIEVLKKNLTGSVLIDEKRQTFVYI